MQVNVISFTYNSTLVCLPQMHKVFALTPDLLTPNSTSAGRVTYHAPTRKPEIGLAAIVALSALSRRTVSSSYKGRYSPYDVSSLVFSRLAA